jgi:hypothetical protein
MRELFANWRASPMPVEWKWGDFRMLRPGELDDEAMVETIKDR